MTGTLYRIELRADQVLHLGVGRGSGFSGTTRRHVPGSTLRGALCAAWWRDHPGGDQAEFDALVGRVSFSDAVPAAGTLPDGPVPGVPAAAAMDRARCKYPTSACPVNGHPWSVQECPHCGGRTEPSKGERSGAGATVLTATRVALTPQETAVDDRLFAREGLHPAKDNSLIAFAVGDVPRLVSDGEVVRIGAARSVAGRATLESVTEYPVPTLALPAGRHTLRVELITAAVFVDEFGFAARTPSTTDLAPALGLPAGAEASVDRAFTRWTTASGWHAMANAPKPEDAAVVAHSVFHLTLTSDRSVELPRLVHGLGLRTTEGYGWAVVGLLDEPEEELQGTKEEPAHA